MVRTMVMIVDVIGEYILMLMICLNFPAEGINQFIVMLSSIAELLHLTRMLLNIFFEILDSLLHISRKFKDRKIMVRRAAMFHACR